MEIQNNKDNILEVISEISSAVVGHFQMDHLLDQIINTTMKILNAEVCSIFLEDHNDKPGILRCVAGSGFAKHIVGRAEYKIGEGFTGKIAELGKEIIINSRAEYEQLEINGETVWKGKHDKFIWPSGKSEFRNCIALPLKIKDRVFGVIKVENKIDNDSFTKEDVILLKAIANVISLTLENARLHRMNEEQLKTISSKAAHRINNQVTNYEGIELRLMEEIDSEIPNKDNLNDLLFRLREVTRILKVMINEIRTFGMPIILKKEYCAINKLIQDEIWLAKPQQNIRIHLNADKNLPKAYIDIARFAESIKELLTNSMKAISNSKIGGNIDITTKYIRSENRYPEYILVLIEDDGPGLPKNFPLFTPFFSTDPKSTGLGLSTVKELIEAHGGTIDYINKNIGASFELHIPV